MRYKIVLVPFPFDDLSNAKIRPALCLTDVISVYDHVVVSFITSQMAKATEESDLHLLSGATDFTSTGLKVDSAIRLHRLITIPRQLIQRQLGTLPASYQEKVEQKIRVLFGV